MTPYWLTFTDRKPACAWVADEVIARELGAKHGTVKDCREIGYPARPRLDDGDGWGKDQCPSFCIAPERGAAAGGSCVNPHGRSCTS